MNLGTNSQIVKAQNIPDDYILSNDQMPKYHYNDVVPAEYLSGNAVIDKAVAATILNASGYITDWELMKVAEWVKRVNKHKLFEVMRICNRLKEGRNLYVY